MPPIVAFAPGSIGKNRPVPLSSALTCSRVTPACTRQSRSAALIVEHAVHLATGRRTRRRRAPRRGPRATCPTPNAMTGTRAAWHSAHDARDLLVGVRDRRRRRAARRRPALRRAPCCSRIAALVFARAPKSRVSASTTAATSSVVARARSGDRGRSWLDVLVRIAAAPDAEPRRGARACGPSRRSDAASARALPGLSRRCASNASLMPWKRASSSVRELHAHRIELLDADAVLAGDRAADFDAQLEDAVAERDGLGDLAFACWRRTGSADAGCRRRRGTRSRRASPNSCDHAAIARSTRGSALRGIVPSMQ